MGASQGGYAAVRAGLALKARVVLAFSPQVFLRSEERDPVAAPTPWLNPYLLKLQLVAEVEGLQLSSLIEAVETTATDACIMQIHTGKLDGDSAKELEMLRMYAVRKAGPAGMARGGVKQAEGIKVSVRPHPNDDPLTGMRKSGELQALLTSYASTKGGSVKKKKKASAEGVRAVMGRSQLWMSSQGREEAALKAGLTDLSGPVVRASDGRGFDPEIDARALPGESESQFKAMLTMWKRIEADDLPGFFFWHKPAFDLVHANLIDIATIFFEYCKKGAAVGGAGKNAADGFTMSQREWVAMCKDGKVPVSIGEINDAHRRCDRPTKEAKQAALSAKKGAAAKADKQLCLPEFVEALIRLAVKLLATTGKGKKALKEGNGGEGFKRLMKKYILPLKERDSMAAIREQMDSSEVCAVLSAFKAPLEKQFLAIARRQTKVLDPTKRPKGDGTKPMAAEAPYLTVEDFCKDIDQQKMFCELKEVRASRRAPVKEEGPCEGRGPR